MTFRHNMLLEGKGNVSDFYDHMETIGEGSISTITKVRKKNAGGSARPPPTKHKRRTKRVDGRTDILGRFLGSVTSSRAAASKVESAVSQASSVDQLGSSLRFGKQAAFDASTSNDNKLVQQYKDETESSSGGVGSGVGSEDNHIRHHNEMIFALKSIDLRVINDDHLRELRNEIEVLKTLDHPNVVRAYETFQQKKNIHLIMENLTGGDLHTRHPYTEREAATIVGKILSAILYMHSKNIIHRDIKYENIMFENSRPDAEPKLIDFGLAKAYLSSGHQMTERVGTVYT